MSIKLFAVFLTFGNVTHQVVMAEEDILRAADSGGSATFSFFRDTSHLPIRVELHSEFSLSLGADDKGALILKDQKDVGTQIKKVGPPVSLLQVKVSSASSAALSAAGQGLGQLLSMIPPDVMGKVMESLQELASGIKGISLEQGQPASPLAPSADFGAPQ